MSVKVLNLVRKAEGGMKQHILSLIDNIDKNSYSIYVACDCTGVLARELAKRQITVFPVTISSSINPWLDMASVANIRSLLQLYRPSLLHAHGMRAWQIAVAALPKDIPLVVTIHNFPYKMNWAVKIMHRVLAARTVKVISVSNALAEYMRSCGIPSEKIAVIHNGIDLNLSAAENSISSPKDKKDFIIGTAARLIPQKGIDVLLKAFYMLLSKHDHTRLLIAGDGPSRISLEQWCWQMGIADRVCFLGYIEDINSFMMQLDAFVLPSLSEGFGISVLEAMACNKPVVASAVGGIPEIIVHGKTGFLSPPGDVEALQLYLEYMIENRDKAAIMGRAAREYIVCRFDTATMIKKIEDIYRSVYSR